MHQVSGRLARAGLWLGTITLVLGAAITAVSAVSAADQENTDVCAAGRASNAAAGLPHLATYPFNSC